MAERVGKNVESFAEALDKFSTNLASLPGATELETVGAETDPATAAARFDAAQQLVEEFGALAAETVTSLRKSVERERAAESRREWASRARIENGPLSAAAKALTTTGNASDRRGSGTSSVLQSDAAPTTSKKSEQVALLRRWQQEVDLWDLFRLVLGTHAPRAVRGQMREERNARLQRMPQPHRYSSERELWDRFLLEDDIARERHLIKRWLEKTAEHQDSDLSGIVEELEMRAGRGKGLWSSGWLHTRERIKAEKRLRSWPNAADSPLPQIRRSDANDLLVTTLDPDAALRQQRSMEKPDVFFERALWVVCWEMLRRGKSAHEVSEWCEQRKEGWRALSLGQTHTEDEDGAKEASSSEAWRRICRLTSESGCSSDYEAAVYGLLGGNVSAVLKVCHSFDDHLYAYYSTMLLRQFDDYVHRVCRPWDASNDSNDDDAEQAVVDLLIRLRKGTSTKAEATQPLKTIQGYLLGNMASSLVTTVGAMIGLTASTLHGNETQGLIEPAPAGVSESAPETAVALDPQALRIVAHMAIILRVAHPEASLEAEDLALEENVIVAYMQALRAAGKRDNIPLYASKLQPDRYITALGHMLQDVTQPREQREMLQLLQTFSLNVPAILDAHIQSTIATCLGQEPAEVPSLNMLEMVEETKLWPGERIRLGFMPEQARPEDEAVLNCLQFFMLLPGHWGLAFAALSTMLRKCLVTGRFACARAIVEKYPYEEVSLQKSHETIGRTLNPMDETTASRATTEEERFLLNLLKRQSQIYYDLEQLVHAVEALSDWREHEHTYVSKTPKPASVPTVVKRAREAVAVAMQPIIAPPAKEGSGGLLARGVDDDSVQTANETADLARIRTAYIPDIIIAYTVVLHAAGNLITRDSLLESMDLAAIIAKGDNGLLDTLREAKRLRELVAMFALTSKVMLVLKGEGKPWKMRKDREGRDLGMWEIGGRKLGDDEMDVDE